MVVAFEPVTVVQEFFFDILRVDPTVLALLGNPPAIRPAFAPDERPDLFVTPRYDAELATALPLGRGVALLRMRWRVIGWRRGYSQLGLRELMRAIMAALVGVDTIGRAFNFVDSDGVGWAIHVQYGGSPVTSPEPGDTEVWQQIAAYYDVSLRQKG